MLTKEAIKKGIGAHGMWKQRLRKAIETGESEWTPDVVCQDNQCEFGKWLYSCSAEEKASPHYENVKNLHAKFHVSAAKVLSLALSSKTKEAENEIGAGSDYSKHSNALTIEMMAWEKEVS
jgi:hypothetical protein